MAASASSSAKTRHPNQKSEATGQVSGPTLHANALLVEKGAALLFTCHYGLLKAGKYRDL